MASVRHRFGIEIGSNQEIVGGGVLCAQPSWNFPNSRFASLVMRQHSEGAEKASRGETVVQTGVFGESVLFFPAQALLFKTSGDKRAPFERALCSS